MTQLAQTCMLHVELNNETLRFFDAVGLLLCPFLTALLSCVSVLLTRSFLQFLRPWWSCCSSFLSLSSEAACLSLCLLDFAKIHPTWVKRSDSNMFFLPLAPGRWDVSFRYEFRRGSHERSECVDKSLDLQFRAQPPQSSVNHWVASLFSIWYKYKDYFLTLIIHYTLQVNLLSLCHPVCPPETWFDPPKYLLMDLLFTYTG